MSCNTRAIPYLEGRRQLHRQLPTQQQMLWTVSAIQYLSTGPRGGGGGGVAQKVRRQLQML